MFSFLFSKALAVTINPNIPGTNPVTTASGPGAFVANFYQFALMISGVLALGAIVYGGVKYAASAGNPSAQSDGKEWILSALYGLILLGGAYIILYTINPNLVNLNAQSLQPVNLSTPNNQSCTVACPSGTSCINGSCEAANGTVYCGGRTNGQCPVPGGSGDVCVNQGDSINPSYVCKSSTGTFTCGGDPPNSKYGSCPPTLQCKNVNGGTTPQTIHYMCQ